MLAKNKGGQDIRSLVETIGLAHKIKLESVGSLNNREETERLLNYLKEELLG